MLKGKRVLIIGGASAFFLILFFILKGSGGSGGSDIIVDVTVGEFVVDVNTTGELEAKNSIEIKGPSGLRSYRIWQVNLQHIIDEGTYVKKGQYVARLDPSELTNRINDTQLDLEEKESQYTQTQLDTTLQMRQERDELINLEYAVEEKQLILDQSQFEPPATIKQAEIDLDKARRALEQKKQSYEIRRKQNVAKMQEVAAKRKKSRVELEGMKSLQSEFTITAPEDGMLIYTKGWDGKQIKAGSQIHGYNPIVATLPDLSSMNSVTYVNEVDIRKISIGQRVEIGLDAFPDKQLTGKVTRVANVGEQRPNADAKVFQVTIELDGVDNDLRPGMTTSNKVYTNVIREAVSVPLECLHSFQDSITYVYKKVGLNYQRQEVEVGATNANEAQIILGLNKDDDIYLSVPASTQDKDDITLLPEMDGRRQNKKEEKVPQEQVPENKPGRGPQPNT